jgi:RecA-family ATPase
MYLDQTPGLVNGHLRTTDPLLAPPPHVLREPDFLTILSSADGKILTKRHTPTGTTPCDKVFKFTSTEMPVVSLQCLARALDCRPNECVILGRACSYGIAQIPHRRLLHHDRKTGDHPTYKPAKHSFVIVDVDEDETPIGWHHDMNAAVQTALGWLPPEFQGVDVAWRATSSAGLNPGIRLRLAFMLDRPVTGEELKAWFADCPPVDPAVFNPVQMIYGSPVFEGVDDPIKARSGMFKGQRAGAATPPADLKTQIEKEKEHARSVGWQTGEEWDLDEIEKMVAVLPPPADYKEEIFPVLASVASFNVPEDMTMESRCDLVCAWACSGSVEDSDGKGFTAAFARAAQPMAIGPGTLIYMAQENGYQVPSQQPPFEAKPDIFDEFLPACSDPFAPRQVASQNIFADGDDWPVAYTAINRQPVKPLVELLPGFAEKHVVTYLEGLGGIGKSLVALQDALCIAAGRRIYSCDVLRAASLYLNYEEAKEEMDRRIEGIVEYFNTFDLWRSLYPPLDISEFHLWQLKERPRAILAVKPDGEIWVTHFGNRLLHWLAQRRDLCLHTFVVLDGVIDAIWFAGNTRNDDMVVRQVIAELDRLALEYDFTAYAILHPSRAGERTGTGSYAPAWSTKPRAIQSFSRVNLAGGTVVEGTPRSEIGTRRKVIKRSHGADGESLDLRYDRGSFQKADHRGGEDATVVAVDIATRAWQTGSPIRRDGKSEVNGAPLAHNNQHHLIDEYRRRTGKLHGAKHFLAELAAAEKEGRLDYERGGSHRTAGYCPKMLA